MIIAGDSHISVFRKGCMLPERNNKAVKIQWCGPMTINHIIQNHPLAQKLNDLFYNESDWKFISIGNFDVFYIFELIKQGYSREKIINSVTENYKNVFSKLSKNGRFAWLVSFQQINNHSEQDRKLLIDLSKEFNNRIIKICNELNIPVINPLDKITDTEGFIKEEFLDTDMAHLSPNFSNIYFEEIKKITGESLKDLSENYNHTFDTKTISNTLSMIVSFTPEMFCQAFLQAVNLPEFIDDRELIKLQDIISKIMLERLNNKGINLHLAINTDFIDSGLFDSLDLLEIYSLISEKINIDIDYNVDLYDLNTIDLLSQHIFSNYKNQLTKKDFITSMTGNYNIEEQKNIILQSEERISRMDKQTSIVLKELSEITSASGKNEFGFVNSWLALYEAHNKNYKDAVKLMQNSRNLKIKYPLKDGRVNHYLKKWIKIIE